MIAVVSPDPGVATLPGPIAGIATAITSVGSTIGGNITAAGQSISQMINSSNIKTLQFQGKLAGVEWKQDGEEKKNWWTRFLNEKGKWIKEWAQRVAQFNKFMMMIWKFKPIILLCVAIILIFTNLFFYVIMLIAYIVAAIIEVIYFVLSLTPFIEIIGFIFFMITQFMPMIAIVLFMVALLVFAAIFCGILAGVNWMTNGAIKGIVLCQNGPNAWYKIPNFHLNNKFERGVFCSKPCAKGYSPDVTGFACVRKPGTTPAFCPQAQVMRFYSGEADKDESRWTFKDKNTKTDFRFLSKTVERREEALLNHWLDMRKYLEECNNSQNAYGLQKYDNMVINICSSVDAMSDGALTKRETEIWQRTKTVCKQGFCNSRATFPFCNTLDVKSDDDMTELIKRIVLFIISMIVFTLTLIFIFAYANEDY